MPDAVPRYLVVAIHDVTPAHAAALDASFRLLERHGVRQYAVFVVPDWHGAWPLRHHRAFVEGLRTRAAAGCEVFLHGYRHDEVGSGRSALQRVRAFGRTGGEAEFLSLDREHAAARIDRGLDALREVGLEPVGFVPPAWLPGTGLAELLAARHLALTEDAWHIWSVLGGRRLRAPAVRWSTRAAHRALAGVAIAWARRIPDRARAVLRLAIHPPDIDHLQVTRSLERTLASLLEERTPVSYTELLGET